MELELGVGVEKSGKPKSEHSNESLQTRSMLIDNQRYSGCDDGGKVPITKSPEQKSDALPEVPVIGVNDRRGLVSQEAVESNP